MTDEPERDCNLTCWCRNDDPDPEGGMRWEPAAESTEENSC